MYRLTKICHIGLYVYSLEAVRVVTIETHKAGLLCFLC